MQRECPNKEKRAFGRGNRNEGGNNGAGNGGSYGRGSNRKQDYDNSGRSDQIRTSEPSNNWGNTAQPSNSPKYQANEAGWGD